MRIINFLLLILLSISIMGCAENNPIEKNNTTTSQNSTNLEAQNAVNTPAQEAVTEIIIQEEETQENITGIPTQDPLQENSTQENATEAPIQEDNASIQGDVAQENTDAPYDGFITESELNDMGRFDE